MYLVGIRICAIMGFSGFPFLVIPAKAGIQKAAAQLGRPRARYVSALLSESRFTGLWDFQDSASSFFERQALIIIRLAEIAIMAKSASWARTKSCKSRQILQILIPTKKCARPLYIRRQYPLSPMRNLQKPMLGKEQSGL